MFLFWKEEACGILDEFNWKAAFIMKNKVLTGLAIIIIILSTL
jgi:hypothetical protein